VALEKEGILSNAKFDVKEKVRRVEIAG